MTIEELPIKLHEITSKLESNEEIFRYLTKRITDLEERVSTIDATKRNIWDDSEELISIRSILTEIHESHVWSSAELDEYINRFINER